MNWRQRRTLLLVITLFWTLASVAQPAAPAADKYDYRKVFMDLYRAVQERYYDSASGYYRDHEEPAPKYGYAYCWPLCGLLQAYNEAEAAGIGATNAAAASPASPASPAVPSVHRITTLLDKYSSNKPPMSDSPGALIPGYDSYIVEFGGGNRFYDDNQWLGLAWMDAWFRTKEPALLARGKLIYRFMMTGYDTVAGGGLYWEEGKKTTKNTCSNGPGIVLALQLYKATKERKYLDTALLLYHWVDTHLRDSDGLYFDNIRTRDGRIGKAKFSYNTGTMLQANVYLYELTGQRAYLQRATAIADTATRYFYGSGKFRDGYWFNAVLLRGYQKLLKFNKNPAYGEAFKRCLDDALAYDKSPTGVMGSGKEQLLVNQAGMLEMLARVAQMEQAIH
ncbi:MAG TPA: glycoside hydrolase family 76 protein [Puia sp.]|nr:glycoside hydrolase family 76 protein [Puia sp.]